MVQQACNDEYAFEETSALDVSCPRLTLLDGGAASHPAKSETVNARAADVCPPARQASNAYLREHAATATAASVPEPRQRPGQVSAVSSKAMFPALVLSHRLAAGFLLASLAICLVVTLGIDAFRSQGVSSATSSLMTTQIVVSQGDSLWSLAQSHPIDGLSDQETVRWLESENNLSSDALTVGQELSVAAC